MEKNPYNQITEPASWKWFNEKPTFEVPEIESPPLSLQSCKDEVEKEAENYANGQLRLEGWVDDVALKAGFIEGAKWYASRQAGELKDERYEKMKKAFEELLKVFESNSNWMYPDVTKNTWRQKAGLS